MKFINCSVFLATAFHGASAGKVIKVTNGDDDGAGSLRKALTKGGQSQNTLSIEIASDVDEIRIFSPLEYTGSAPLKISGMVGAPLASKPKIVAIRNDFTLFTTTATQQLTISDVNFQGIGGFSAAHRGIGKGIYVDVAADAKGDVNVELTDVAVSDVANHGVHISDCTVEDCGNGNGGTGEGSPATVRVNLVRVNVRNVGQGKFDGDGVRVDERGEGDIIANIEDSTFTGCGADGVELDEAGDGNVSANVVGSHFTKNGDYCYVEKCEDDTEFGADDPKCLNVIVKLDAACIECEGGGTWPVDGKDENPDECEIDLDDGFDMDEADGGFLEVLVLDSLASENLDEGFDFDENGQGGIAAFFHNVTANDNFNEGIKCSSGGAGDDSIEILDSTVNRNQDDGMQLESEGTGRIDVVIENTECVDSKKNDLKVEQAEILSTLGTLELVDSIISSNKIATKNIDLN